MDDVAFEEFIPELRTYLDGEPIDIDSWLSNIGSLEHAVAYGRLFWPSFTIHDDCVLYSDFCPKNYDDFFSSSNGNRTSVEWVMNHQHLLDVFHLNIDPPDQLLLYVGRLVADIWSAKLARDFPDRRMIALFEGDESQRVMRDEVAFFTDRRD